MNRWTFCLLAMVVGTIGVGCAKPQGPRVMQPSTNVQTFTGTLRNVSQVIGGSASGWELVMPAGAGRTPEILPLDVSALPAEAKALEGEEVTVKVSGRTDQNTYVAQSLRKLGQ